MDDWGDWQDVLGNTDYDTARLIVELQTQDVANLAATSGQHGDAAFARSLLQQDLRQLDADLPSRLCGEYLEEDENELEESREVAAFGWALREGEDRIETVPDIPKLVTCIACTDSYHHTKTVKAPCGHEYCNDCIENLYLSCMTDETLFPPRCCHQEFPWELVRHHLTQQCRSKFGSKRIELQTKDRTYCHVASCSVFIKPDTIDGARLATCTRCFEDTCAECKGAFHGLRGACPNDQATQELMDLAEDNEWQQCYGCRRMVELKSGCYHMT